MGCCCSSDTVVDDEFTSFGEDSQQKEVQFEYDEQTGRLVPILERSWTSSSGQRPLHRHHRRSGTPQSSSAGGGGGGGGGPGSKADDESLVDCVSVSNNSIDFELGDNNVARVTNTDVYGDEEQDLFESDSESRGTPSTTNFTNDPSPESPGSSDMNNNNTTTNNNNNKALNSLSFEEKKDRLFDSEEVSRSEIFAAFMVAVQMLRYAMKRITPTMRVVPVMGGGGVGGGGGRAARASAASTTSKHRYARGEASVGTVITLHHRDVLLGGTPSPTSLSGSAGGVMMAGQMTPPAEGEGMMDASGTLPELMTSRAGSSTAQLQMQEQPLDLLRRGGEQVRGKRPSPPSAAAASASSTSLGGSGGRAGGGGGGGATTAAATTNAPTPTHRVELLELDSRGIVADGKNVRTHIIKSGKWDFFWPSPAHTTRVLNSGDALFAFRCCTGDKCTGDDIRTLLPMVNLSKFADEQKDNNVPYIDLGKSDDISKLTLILSKAMYLVPNLEIEDIDAAHWASKKYCEACIAGNPWFDDCDDKYTFRMNKPVVRFVYTLLIQLTISEVTDPRALHELGRIDGFVPARALLYERTKRNKEKTDMTVKAKATLLFHPVPGGMLVCNTVAVFNSAIPTLIASVINAFDGTGAQETSEVVGRTRKHVHETFHLPRLAKQADAGEEPFSPCS